MAAAWRCGRAVIKHTRDREDLRWANDLARMTQVSLVGFAVGGAFQNLAFYDLYYHIVAILFLTQQVIAKSISIQYSYGSRMGINRRQGSCRRRASRETRINFVKAPTQLTRMLWRFQVGFAARLDIFECQHRGSSAILRSRPLPGTSQPLRLSTTASRHGSSEGRGSAR